MNSSHILVIIIFASYTLLSINAQSSSCKDGEFSFEGMGNATHCKKLTTLGAEFGWNHNAAHNQTVDIFFGAKLPVETGWVAWGINPGPKPEMVGTRALIAFKEPNGTFVLKPYNITADTKHGCRLQSSPIDVEFKLRKLNYDHDTAYLTIFVTLTIPNYNLSSLNHVWQVGSLVVGEEPRMHGRTLQNFDSGETIDLTSGIARSASHRRRHLRKVHGILNTIGWGTLIPIGIIIARYCKSFPFKLEYWYRFHVGCQLSGILIGTIGWVIGIVLGNTSKTYAFKTHRILGIVIFCKALLQMLALRLRPKKEDAYRQYWNIYHHFSGYGLFALIAVNIFQGISILRPLANWKWGYVAILSSLGFIVLVLEIYTWVKFFKDAKAKATTDSAKAEMATTDSADGPPQMQDAIEGSPSQKQGASGKAADRTGGPPQKEGALGKIAESASGPPQKLGALGKAADNAGGPPQKQRASGKAADSAGGPPQKQGAPGKTADSAGGPPQKQDSSRKEADSAGDPPQKQGALRKEADSADGPPQKQGAPGKATESASGPPQKQGAPGKAAESASGPLQKQGAPGKAAESAGGPPQKQGAPGKPAGGPTQKQGDSGKTTDGAGGPPQKQGAPGKAPDGVGGPP
ncbi:cytochrome b561 and DOMON domain-containing protein At4g12980-like [Tasmannia lanceolata]|uniref:cytochrome b561 and DOMON domain-containing protein At4g12980-like n=1 Tax=Tasmannia lanceolata TaxID=3420 RepID=UPI004063BB9B